MTRKERIKNSVTIEEVVQKYTGVPLRRGKRMPCPIHRGKDNNFTVYPEKGKFQCYSCGEGGDVIDFVMKRNKVSFMEALGTLERDFGISTKDCTYTAPKKNASGLKPDDELIQLYGSAYMNALEQFSKTGSRAWAEIAINTRMWLEEKRNDDEYNASIGNTLDAYHVFYAEEEALLMHYIKTIL